MIGIEDILFLDIETVPQSASFDELTDAMKKLWEKKTSGIRVSGQMPQEMYERAGIWAEFGKIVCISVGFIYMRGGQMRFRVKSFFNNDESMLLHSFCNLLTKFFSKKKNAKLCAHNGKEFDFPYIARRILINGMKLPKILDISGCKPWEVPFMDTMEMWKFGDYKHFCSLELLTTILNIPSPKNDIDGSQVASVYYCDNDIQRIVRYCEKDVFAVAQLYLRYNGLPLIENVEVRNL